MTTILLVEDEPAIREMIRYALDREGFEVTEAQDVGTAWRKLADRRPDLAIVDWMLPDTPGIEFIRTLRSEELDREMPVIMLTARAEEHDKVKGLDCGADDYMTKPVSLLELFSRINALLRRARGHAGDDKLWAGRLIVDPGAHTVSVGDEAISMGHTEFKLLQFFMSHPILFIREPSCWILSGVKVFMSRSERSMCISCACEKRSNRLISKPWYRPCEAPVIVSRNQVDDRLPVSG